MSHEAVVKARHAVIQDGIYILRLSVPHDFADDVVAAGRKVIAAKGKTEEFRAYVAAKSKARKERAK